MEDRLCGSKGSSLLPAGPLSAPQQRHGRRAVPVRGFARGRPQPAGSSWESEFAKYSDPDRLRRMSEHLELTWNVAKNAQPQTCASCQGTGSQPCTWCNETGAMRLGEYIFCSVETGCKPCPICRSKGCVPCKKCNGTGLRAAWLSP